VTQCSPKEVNGRFRGIYRLSLQGRKVSQSRNQYDADSKQSTYCSTLKIQAVNPSEICVDFHWHNSILNLSTTSLNEIGLQRRTNFPAGDCPIEHANTFECFTRNWALFLLICVWAGTWTRPLFEYCCTVHCITYKPEYLLENYIIMRY
jgi:hypothetical protein